VSVARAHLMSPSVPVREFDITHRIPDLPVEDGYVFAPYNPTANGNSRIYLDNDALTFDYYYTPVQAAEFIQCTFEVTGSSATINPCSEITIYGSQFCNLGRTDHFVEHEDLFIVE
jgi:hypothetical protein